MVEILNICLHQNSISIKFFKILKIHEIFCENPRIIFVLFYDVHKENMFTINLKDGREAPSKASIQNSFKQSEFFSFLRVWLSIYYSLTSNSKNIFKNLQYQTKKKFIFFVLAVKLNLTVQSHKSNFVTGWLFGLEINTYLQNNLKYFKNSWN